MPTSSLTGRILNLAIPAFGALIAPPLFTIIDSAMIGHLGSEELAGLAIASQILSTVTVLFIFLTYSTTSLSARALGRGKLHEALRVGIDATWLAIGLGTISALLLALTAPHLTALLTSDLTVAEHATNYLRATSPGLVGTFITMATVGTLRGLQDTKTPLIVTIAGAGINVVANAALIYGLNLGITGSGLGTALTETLMGAFLLRLLIDHAHNNALTLKPSRSGLGTAVAEGIPLIIRGLMLRLAGIATLWPVAQTTVEAVAGYQVALAVWNLAALALDALAIAAQAMIGKAVGAQDSKETRQLLRTLSLWGLYFGFFVGIIMIASSTYLPMLFGTSPAMWQAATWGLIASALGMPIAGVVFLLDGVLIGAGEGRYLAGAGVIQTLSLLPALAFVEWWRHIGGTPTQIVAGAWLSYSLVYVGVRLVTNAWRTWFSPRSVLPR